MQDCCGVFFERGGKVKKRYAHKTGKMTHWKMVNLPRMAKNGLLYNQC